MINYTNFDEIRFPDDIAYGSSGGPEYSTEVITSISGNECRNANWQHARARYNVAHGVKTNEQLEELITFFRGRLGKAIGFRFKDWSDYRAQDQFLGQIDRSTLEAIEQGADISYQLHKYYCSGQRSAKRKINKPVADSLQIKDETGLSISYVCDYTSGKVTLDKESVENLLEKKPASKLYTSFEFDVPVRFDTDHLNATLDEYGINSWREIPLVEIKF